MTRRAIVAVAALLFCASCQVPSGLVISDVDVNASQARVWLTIAEASPLRVVGLSAPPSSGTVRVAVPRWWAKSGLGWWVKRGWDRRASFAVLWKASGRSGEWDFLEHEGQPELMCWAEWQHSSILVRSPEVAGGHEFYEQLRFTSGTGGGCDDRSGFVVEHWGSHGIRTVTLKDVPMILAEWGERRLP